MHEQVAYFAAHTPLSTAVVAHGESISFELLNRRAEQLASYLQMHHNVQSDQLIGVCLERSIEFVVTVLGVLKAGAAYVPMDPTLPTARLAYIVSDTQTPVVLTDSHHAAQFSSIEVNTLFVDTLTDGMLEDAVNTTGQHPCQVMPSNLAYVIYTSGSTGQPKGVMIEHRAFSNYVQSERGYFDLTPNSKVLNTFSMSFDAGNGHLFSALCAGSCVYIGEDSRKGIDYLFDFIAQHQISHAVFPYACLLYTSPSPRDRQKSRMPSSA